MGNVDLVAMAEEFLFGRGLTLDDYFIEQTPIGEMLCYTNAEGRAFDLLVNDEELSNAMLSRLKELGVRIVSLD